MDAFEGKHPGYEFSYPSCHRDVGSEHAEESKQTSAQETNKTEKIPQNMNADVKEASGKFKIVDSQGSEFSGKGAEKDVRPTFNPQGPPAPLEQLLANKEGEALCKCDMATYLDVLFEARKCAVMNNEQVRKDFQSLNGVSVSKSDLGNFLCEEAKQKVIY